MPGDITLERTLPQNVESEKAVLGAILLDEKAVFAASEVLVTDDFYLLAALTDGLPRALNVGHYARTVREKAASRQLIGLADEMTSRCYRGRNVRPKSSSGWSRRSSGWRHGTSGILGMKQLRYRSIR